MITYLVWGTVLFVSVMLIHIFLMVQSHGLIEEVDKEQAKLPYKTTGSTKEIALVAGTVLLMIVAWPISVTWLLSILFRGENLAHWFRRSFKKLNGTLDE